MRRIVRRTLGEPDVGYTYVCRVGETGKTLIQRGLALSEQKV